MRQLLLISFLLIAGVARAEFNPNYDEAVFLSKMELNIDQGVYECSVPVTSYLTHTYTNGRNYYAQQITDASVDGQPCITHIVYDKGQEDQVTSADGYLGNGHDVVNTAGYRSVVTQTVGDMNTYTDEEGNTVEYTGVDKDDPWPVWVFLQKDYEQ
jgi:hypothetical protein